MVSGYCTEQHRSAKNLLSLRKKIEKMLKLLRQNKNWSLSSEIWNIYQNYLVRVVYFFKLLNRILVLINLINSVNWQTNPKSSKMLPYFKKLLRKLTCKKKRKKINLRNADILDIFIRRYFYSYSILKKNIL